MTGITGAAEIGNPAPVLPGAQSAAPPAASPPTVPPAAPLVVPLPVSRRGSDDESTLLPAITIENQETANQIMEGYRSGTISKASAIIQIQKALIGGPIRPRAEVALTALNSYIAVLDNFNSFRNAAGKRGQAQATGFGGTPEEPDKNISEHEEEGEQGIDSVPIKRGREVDGEDDEGESLAIKRKIDVNQFAWIAQEETSPTVLSLELRKTIALLENFARDPKFAKSSLLNSPSCPQFPDAEWTNLLAGHVVNLDHILTGVYSVAADDRIHERFGNVEFITGPALASRVVRSHSEFVIAWEIYVDAALFVFPHRKRELESYGRYIKQLFTSVPASLHDRVLLFEKGVRTHVAQRRNLLLTDFFKFNDLHTLWILHGGPSGTGSSSTNPSSTPARRTNTSSGSGGNRRQDACRRWNKSRCPNSAANCNYAHICGKC